MTNNEAIAGLEAIKKQAGYLTDATDDPVLVLNMGIQALKEAEPRVLTLLEVIDHYSVPYDVQNDMDRRIDLLCDIKPLYFDYPIEDPFNLHWRGYDTVIKYLDEWKPRYGKTWRVWTDKPTDEQRKAVAWD